MLVLSLRYDDFLGHHAVSVALLEIDVIIMLFVATLTLSLGSFFETFVVDHLDLSKLPSPITDFAAGVIGNVRR